MVFDVDDYALFENKDDALAAARLDEKPRVYVRRHDDQWGISPAGGWLVWSEMPKSAHARGADVTELAEIWDCPVEDFAAFLRGELNEQDMLLHATGVL